MTNKFVASKPFISALLLMTGILFIGSCSKRGTVVPDALHPSSTWTKLFRMRCSRYSQILSNF